MTFRFAVIVNNHQQEEEDAMIFGPFDYTPKYHITCLECGWHDDIPTELQASLMRDHHEVKTGHEDVRFYRNDGKF